MGSTSPHLVIAKGFDTFGNYQKKNCLSFSTCDSYPPHIVVCFFGLRVCIHEMFSLLCLYIEAPRVKCLDQRVFPALGEPEHVVKMGNA